MKKITSNLLTIITLIFIAILYSQHSPDELNYWRFISHNLVLNVDLAFISIAVGFFVKNYLLVMLGAGFSLAMYCLVLLFSPDAGILIQFFLAIFTVFLAFSVISNLCRHYKDWVLADARA